LISVGVGALMIPCYMLSAQSVFVAPLYRLQLKASFLSSVSQGGPERYSEKL